jgi:peptide/nickel transport system ATP-binding protein
VTIQAQILELLRKLQEQLGMAVLLITHDLGVVAEYASSVVVMYAGRVVERATVKDLFARPRHPYTVGLLGSMPQPSESGARKRLRTIEGVVPDLRDLRPGCRFADRCSMAMEACRKDDPPLVEVEPGHLSRCLRAAELGGPA